MPNDENGNNNNNNEAKKDSVPQPDPCQPPRPVGGATVARMEMVADQTAPQESAPSAQ